MVEYGTHMSATPTVLLFRQLLTKQPPPILRQHFVQMSAIEDQISNPQLARSKVKTPAL
jgi:hypothetical protein